jgi:hypothetical protein
VHVRSTINNHLAVVNAIYSWAAYPTRRLEAGTARDIELPAGDETKRLRIADPAEAVHLIDASRRRRNSVLACGVRLEGLVDHERVARVERAPFIGLR